MNYIPISLLHTPAKLFKKIIYGRLMNFINKYRILSAGRLMNFTNKYRILSACWYIFRAGFSTTYAVRY